LEPLRDPSLSRPLQFLPDLMERHAGEIEGVSYALLQKK
jgi:hypothetical protein